MNQLQIFILILMIIFTIINFWTDLKNFWNTGNKFGEGFVGRLDPSVMTVKSKGTPNESINPEECQAVSQFDSFYGYPFSKINEAGNPKGCFIQHGTAPGVKGVYYNESGTANCGAFNVSLCIEKRKQPPNIVFTGKPGVTGISLTAAECKDFADEQQGKNWHSENSWDSKPSGCIEHPNTNRIFYNKKSNDKSCNYGGHACIEKPNIYLRVTSGKGDVTGKSLTADECKQYANYNKYGYGINNNNPKGCIKTGNQVRLSTGGGQGRLSMCSTTNSCIEKYRPPTITPEAAAMTTESPSNETPVVNNIQAPPPPEWHDSKLAKQFKLPNGHLVRPGEGVCPNACKIPHYDQKNCANEILDGKEYRTCPWVKDGTSDMDCKSCGAVLIPKNKYGFARTNPALLDVNHVNDVMKITNVEDSKDNKYNMGKNFMKQLSFIRHFALPDSITTDEYVTIGKLINAHQKYPKSHKIETTLTKFINTILRTNSLSENGKNIRASELISAQINSQGGNFDVDEKKLSGEGVLAYKQGLEEAASNNRLGGSKTLYREMTEDSGYTKQYHPRDPRRKPSPYNSIWNIFNY